jgi:general secretion pathway protein I
MNQRALGFTLLEVLIAVAILAVAFTAILTSLSGNIRQVSSLRDKTAAHWVALNVIASYQLHLIGNARTGDNQSGSATMLKDEWNWALTSQKTTNADVIQVDVEVRKQTTQQKVLTLTGFTNTGAQ